MGFAEVYLNWNRGGREMAEAQQRARQEQLRRQEEERRRQEQEAARAAAEAQAAAEQREAYEAELQRRREKAARDLEAQDRHKKKDNENIKADRYQKVFSEYNLEDPYDPKNALLWKAWSDYGYNDNEDIEDAYNVAVRRNQTIQDEHTADYIRYRQQTDYAAGEPQGAYATDQERRVMREYGLDYQTAKAVVAQGKQNSVEGIEKYKSNMMQYGIHDAWLDPLEDENKEIDITASRELESRKAYGLSQGKASELDGADPMAVRLAKENPTLTYQEAKDIVKGARWQSDNSNHFGGDEDSVYQRANEQAQSYVSKRAERIVNQREATEEFNYGFLGEGNLQGMAQGGFRDLVGAEANPETGEYEYGGNLAMQFVDFTVGTVAGLPYGITSVVKQPRKMLSDIEMGGTLQEDESGELARKAYTGTGEEAAEVGDLLLNFVDDLPGIFAVGKGAKIATAAGESALKRLGGVLSTSAKAGAKEAPVEATQGLMQDKYEGRETDWKNIGEQAFGGFIGGSAMGMGGAAAGVAGKVAAKPLAKAGEAIKAVGSEVAAGFSEAVNKVPAKPVKTTANAPDAGRIASVVKSVKPHTIEEVNEVASMLSEELGRKVSTTEVWAALYRKPSEIEDNYRKRSVYDEDPEAFVQKQEAEAEAAAKAEQEAAAKAEADAKAEAKKTAPKKEKVVVEPVDIANVGEDIVGENALQAVQGKVTGKKVKRLTEDGKRQPLTLEERAEQASIEDIKQASVKLKNIVSGKDTTFAITRQQRERYEALLDGGIAENGKEIYIEVENYNASKPAIKGYKKSNGRFDGKSETAEQKAKRLANTNEAFSAVEGKVSDRVPEGSRIAIIGSKKYKLANMKIMDGGIAATLNHLGIAKPSAINTVDNTGVSAPVSMLVTKNFPESTLNNFKQNEKAHGKSAIYKATDRAVKNADALIVYWDGDETTEGNKATKAAMDRASVNGIPVFAVNSRGEIAEYHYDGAYVQPEGGTKRSRIIEKGAEMYAALKANDASAYAKAESELMEIISGNAAYVAKSGMGSTYTNNSRYNISEAVSDIKKDWLEYIRKRINSYKGKDNARDFGEYLYGGQKSGLIWAMNHPSHTVAVLEKLGFEKKPSTVNSKATLLSAFGDDPQISSKNELIDASVAEASRSAGSYGNYLLSQKDDVSHSSKAGKVTQQNLIEVTADSKKIMKARAMLANGIRNMKQFRAYISLLFESEEDIQLMLDIAQSRKETVAILRAEYSSLANNKTMKEEIISALDEAGGDAKAIRDYYISLGDTDLVGREVVEGANGKEVIEDNIKADAAAIKAAINDPKAVEVNYLDVLAESIMKTKEAKTNIGDVRKMAATIFMKFHDKRAGWSEQRKNDVINAIINYILERRSKGHPDYSVYKGVDYTEKYFTTAVNTIGSINKNAKAAANKREPYISEVGKVLNSLIETDDYRQVAAEASSKNQLISTSGPTMFEQVEEVAQKYSDESKWADLQETKEDLSNWENHYGDIDELEVDDNNTEESIEKEKKDAQEFLDSIIDDDIFSDIVKEYKKDELQDMDYNEIRNRDDGLSTTKRALGIEETDSVYTQFEKVQTAVSDMIDEEAMNRSELVADDAVWDDLSEEEKMSLLIDEQGLSSMTNNDAENLDMYDNAGYMLQQFGDEYRKSGKKSSTKKDVKSIPRGIGYALGKTYSVIKGAIDTMIEDFDKLKHDTYKRKLIANQVAAMRAKWYEDFDNPDVKTRLSDSSIIERSPYFVKPKGITGATKNIIRILQEEYGVPVFYTTSRMIRRGHEAGVFENPDINGMFSFVRENFEVTGYLIINIDKESNASTMKSLGDMLSAMGPSRSPSPTMMTTAVHEAAHLAQQKALKKIEELADKIENPVVAATYYERMIADYVTGIDENNYDEMMLMVKYFFDRDVHEPAAYATEDLIKRYSAGGDFVFHGDEFLEVYEKSKGYDEKNIDGSEITASPIQAAAQLIMNIGDRNKHRVLPEGVKFETLEEARTAALVKGYGGFGSIAAKFMNWWNRYHDSTLVVGLSKTDLEDRFNPLKNIERVTNLLVRHLSDTTYMVDPTVIEQLMYRKKYLLNAKRGESFSLRTAVNNLARVDIILAGYLKTAGMAKLINKAKLDPEFSKRCEDYMWARYLLADRELGIKKINFLMPGTKTMEESFARAEEVVAAMDNAEALMIDAARLKINNLNLELSWKTGQINPERYNEILDINDKGKYFIPLRKPSVAGDGNKFVGSTMDKTSVANQGLINEMPDTTAKEGEEIQYTRAEDFLHPLTALADATYEGCVKSGSNQILVDIAKQWKIITETQFFNVKSRDGATLKTSGKNTIEFDYAGEKYIMEVPTFISDTINNEFLPITHKLLTVPAQLIRMGSTGMNIEFIVGLNMVRDFMSSSLFTPDGHKLWIHLPKAIATLVFASKERSKLVSLGAISDSFNLVTVTRNEYGEVKKERVDVTPQKAEAIRQGFRFLWSGMNFFENITRVANFYNALDHGQKRNYDDPLGYAVYVAQHGSGNFHNVGDCKMMRANAQLTPYSQSSIAGAAGAREMFWMNPVQSMLRSLTFVGAVAMTNAMSVGMLGYPGEDDEDREKRADIFGNISSGDKEQNIILPLPDAEFILIPAPQSMYALLKLINDNKGPGRTQEEGSWAAETVLYAIAGISGLNITGNNWWQMVSGLASYIPLVGTFVKPGLEIWAGKSFFTGKNLRSDDEEALIGTSQEWSIGIEDTKPWIKTISTALHAVGFNHVTFSPSGIETLIANAFGTWGRRYVTNQALPINPLAVYKINKNTDLRTYEEKTYDYTKFENAIIKKFGISGSDGDGRLARAKTVYNAGQKLARVAEDLVYGDRVILGEEDWVALRQYVSGISDASGEEADAVQDRAMVLAYQIMKARVDDTSEDINTDLYFETNAELYAAPMETQQEYFTVLFQAGQMFNQPRAMAKAILGLSAEWEDMSVEERVSKGRLVATDMNAVEGYNDAIISGGAETKEDYARILFSGYTGKKISDRQLIILTSMQETPNGRIGDCGFNIDLWITQEELSEMKKADEYVVSSAEYNARAAAFYEKLIDAHETFDVEGLDKGWDDLSTTESILYRGTVAALNESLMVDKELQKHYETMGLEKWRDNYLGKNGEEAAELALVLKALDDARTAAGVSLNTTDHSKNKYYLKESSGGTGRYGGGGGSQHMLSLTELRAAMKQYFPKGNSVSTGMTVDTKGTRAITPATKGKNYSSGELIMPTSYTPTNKNVVKYKRSKTRQGNMGQSYMDFLSGTNKSQGNFRAARKYE